VLFRSKNQSLFIVDEIQKAPQLLDEVHRLIEKNKKLRFILTGSSARKLRKEGVNLLGGRASKVLFHPLVFPEFATDFKFHSNFLSQLENGGLPSVTLAKNPKRRLSDYVGLYLKEEIQNESLVRSLDNFSRFLDILSLANSEQVNFNEIGNDAQVAPSTVRDYYQILVDTLIGDLVPGFTKTKKRKAMSTAKFYFFDTGVAHCLTRRSSLTPGSIEFGKAVEHYVYLQLKAYLSYKFKPHEINYWRSTSNLEVDFVVHHGIEEIFAFEVKAGVNPNQSKGLLALAEEFPLKRKIIICLADQPRLTESGIEILPMDFFLKELWKGKIF
jgi:predicted AAA+ superfamily ATPase